MNYGLSQRELIDCISYSPLIVVFVFLLSFSITIPSQPFFHYTPFSTLYPITLPSQHFWCPGRGGGGGGGGGLCPLSNLRNGNVACHYRFALSCRVASTPCRMSNLRNDHVAVSNLVVQTHTSPHIHVFPYKPHGPNQTQTSLNT